MPDFVERLRSGDQRWLARAISAAVEHDDGFEPLLQAAYRAGGQARVLGLTGPPGAGKSTLADTLARRYRAAGETVGIVAVDPTSPFTGGAILGDRIRMQAHHGDPGIFIRSLATRGSMGGLAAAAADVVALFDAAGKNRILVETVGVGQDEVDVVQLADVVMVVLVPGMGDEVQAIKAGIMEIADIFVINKSDRGPERLEQEIKGMLGLREHAPGEELWHPPIIKTVASEGAGVEQVESAIASRLQWMDNHGGLAVHRAAQWRQRLPLLARERLAQRLLAPALTGGRLEEVAAALAAHRADPYTVLDELIASALAPHP